MNPQYTTLISAVELKSLMDEGRPLMVFDCSFDLAQPEAGRSMYQQAHIAGALFADLDHDLSAKSGAARADAASGGRHPLPSRARFGDWLGERGFTNTMQAVVYDRQGTNYCGRLWWMLRWVGHEAVAVLNGGFQAWQVAGGATDTGTAPPKDAAPFTVKNSLVHLIDAASVNTALGRAGQTILDARGAARFRGELEPIDPVAGHIPGALNRPFGENMDASGLFKPAAQLRREFEELLGQRSPAGVVHHCGSGVSAVPNVLAMEIAGLGGSALFAGSWSEWCSDPARPVARG
jgi:thiosulfate/3-mercaptopyruvate sulfurtransferase